MMRRPHTRLLRSSVVAFLAAALAACVLVPAGAVGATKVKPANGKWGGNAQTVQCDSTPVDGTVSIDAAPPATCAGAAVPNVETLAFTLTNRHVTALQVDVQIQCLTSDSPDRMWVANQLRIGSSDRFSYVGLNGTTVIRPNGVLRMGVPVEDTFDHVGGTLQVTLDFRGAKPKAAVFFSGAHEEAGYFQRCVSTQNAPSAFSPRLLRAS